MLPHKLSLFVLGSSSPSSLHTYTALGFDTNSSTNQSNSEKFSHPYDISLQSKIWRLVWQCTHFQGKNWENQDRLVSDPANLSLFTQHWLFSSIKSHSEQSQFFITEISSALPGGLHKSHCSFSFFFFSHLPHLSPCVAISLNLLSSG